MSNNNYTRGRAFEYRVKNYLESHGYTVFRTAGSHSIADLIAFKATLDPLFVQCKTGSARLNGQERKELISVSVSLSAIPILATKNNKGRIELYCLGLVGDDSEFLPG